jgi:hypothetical protein
MSHKVDDMMQPINSKYNKDKFPKWSILFFMKVFVNKNFENNGVILVIFYHFP